MLDLLFADAKHRAMVNIQLDQVFQVDGVGALPGLRVATVHDLRAHVLHLQLGRVIPQGPHDVGNFSQWHVAGNIPLFDGILAFRDKG